jgi:hypothetical protein
VTSTSTIFIETLLSKERYIKIIIPFPTTVKEFKKAFPKITKIYKKGSRLSNKENTLLNDDNLLNHNSYYILQGLDSDLFKALTENESLAYTLILNNRKNH